MLFRRSWAACNTELIHICDASNAWQHLRPHGSSCDCSRRQALNSGALSGLTFAVDASVELGRLAGLGLSFVSGSSEVRSFLSHAL